VGVLNGLLYLGYLLVAGEWRPLLFRPRDVRPAIEMQKYYLHLRREHPPQGKHNALQKGAYSFIVVLGMLSVVTGLSLWKPVLLSWLTALFGGYELARYWHFVAVWLFVAFTLDPMLSSRLLRKQTHANPVFRFLEWSFRKLERTYGFVLGWCLRHRLMARPQRSTSSTDTTWCSE
jgi:thiosulfate reductase cytochrome b subunit